MGRSVQRYVNLQAKIAPRIRADRRQQKPEVTYRETQRYIDEHVSRQEAQKFSEAVRAVQNFHVEPCMSGDGSPYVALGLALTALGGFAVAPTYNAHAESPDKGYKSPEKSRAAGDNQPVKDMVAEQVKLKTDYRTNMADGRLSEGERAQILTDAVEVRNDPTLPKYSTLQKDVGPAYQAMKQKMDTVPSPPDSCFGDNALDARNIQIPAVKTALQTKDITNSTEKIDASKQTRIGANIDEMNSDVQKNEAATWDCTNGDSIVLPSDIAPLGQSPSYSGEVQEKYVNGLIAMLKSLETDLTNTSKTITGKYWSLVAGKGFSTEGERAAAVLQELEAHDDPTKNYWDSTGLWDGPYDKAKQNDTPTLIGKSLPDGKTRTPYLGEVQIEDPSGDIVQASMGGLPNATWDPVTGKITGNFSRADAGLHEVGFYARDSWGNEVKFVKMENVSYRMIDVEIVSDNNLPGVDNVPLDKVYTRNEFKWKPNVSDADGDVLSVGLVNGPDGMTYDEKTGEIKWTPNRTQVGTYDFTLAISDGFDVVKKTYHVQSLSDNQKPSIQAPARVTVYSGQKAIVGINGSDADGDPLDHNISLTRGAKNYKPAITKDGNNVRIEFDTKGLPTGTYRLKDKVTDGYAGGDAERGVDIEVLPNAAPVFAPSTPSELDLVKGKVVNIGFSAIDDSGDVKYEASGLPQGLRMTENGKVIGKPTHEGKGSFVVTAIDEQNQTTPRTVNYNIRGSSTADQNVAIGVGAVALGTAAVVGYAARNKIASIFGRKKPEPPADEHKDYGTAEASIGSLDSLPIILSPEEMGKYHIIFSQLAKKLGALNVEDIRELSAEYAILRKQLEDNSVDSQFKNRVGNLTRSVVSRKKEKSGDVPAYLSGPVGAQKKAEFKGLYLMKEDGRLMAGWYTGEKSKMDPDMFASQYTALAQFTKDVDGEEPEEVILKGKRYFMRTGKDFRIVVVAENSGKNASDVKEQADRFVKAISRHHAKVIARWDGKYSPILDDLIDSTEGTIVEYLYSDPNTLHRTFDVLPEQVVKNIREGTYVPPDPEHARGELKESDIKPPQRKIKIGTVSAINHDNTDRVAGKLKELQEQKRDFDVNINKLGEKNEGERKLDELTYQITRKLKESEKK